MKAPSLLLLVVLVSACTSAPPADRDEGSLTADQLLSGAAILGEPLDRRELPRDPVLSLTPDMRTFLAGIAPGESPQRRLAALIRAFEEQQFQVEYDEGSTLTAAETFHQQRGNCLAFTVMMVAMVRELGAEAYFNEVDVPPVWGHDEAQTFVVYRHINMVSNSPRGRRVVDFNLAAYDPVYEQRKLSDTEALAQYYSNRGVELMGAGDSRQAFLYLRKALDLLPGDADLWSNLGALNSRFGHLNQAEQSYRQALLLDEGNLVAISNLERLSRSRGKVDLADYYAKRARYHRERNPYYLYYLARSAYEEGAYRLAQKQLRRALWKYENDHRFHFLMGLTNYRLGEFEDSRDSFREAFSLAERPETRNAYLHKLEFLRQTAE